MRLRTAVVSVLGLALAGSVGSVAAQTARSGGGDARAMQQLQQQAAELTAMRSENTRLKQASEELQKKLDASKAELDALTRRAQAAESASGRLAASNANSAENATRTRAQMDELVARFREAAKALKDVETERDALKQQAQAADRRLATCRNDNAKLLEINEEVLVRLENTGFWTKLAADEPFTRLKRTELENLALEYRAKAEDLAVTAPTGQAP